MTGGVEEAEEGSPQGEGNQFPDEDQGYNPLVPGRVIYIYRLPCTISCVHHNAYNTQLLLCSEFSYAANLQSLPLELAEGTCM